MSQSDKKKEFHETLSELIEFATVSGNIISIETIKEYFKDFSLDETQFSLIYKYLTDAKITIEGMKEPETSAINNNPPKENDTENLSLDFASYKKTITESNEALNFHEMYLNELHALNSFDKMQAEALLKNLTAAKQANISELTSLYLPFVIRLCEDFEDKGLSHSDLVAEGNLALLEAIYKFCDICDTDKNIASFENFITKEITNALTTAINAEIGSNRISNHLADQVNALNNASTELAKEYGREATLEELCQYLSLSEEEVTELMKVSIQALTIIETDET